LAVEFGGTGTAQLSLNARRTRADDVLLDYVRARSDAPFQAQHPDPTRSITIGA